MRFVIFILMLLLSLNVFGQDGKLRITRIDTSCHFDNDTPSFLGSYYYGLPDIRKSLYKTHIHVSLIGKFVDLFSEDNKKYSGFVTNYVYQTIDPKDKKAVKEEYIISNRFALDSLACEKSANFILESKQHQFEMDSVNTSWHKYFCDCNVVVFQFKLSDTIITQSFVCPNGQNDSVFGNKIVVANTSFLNQELKLESLSDSFVSLLPKDCYNCSFSFGGNVSFRNVQKIILTKRKSKMYAQKRANQIYLDSLSVKLNSFIQSELVRLIPTTKREEFYDDYVLRFSKSNRLQKVKSDFTFFSKDDKNDFRKRRRHLKMVFRKINLDFVHSKFGYSKKLEFDKDGNPRVVREGY